MLIYVLGSVKTIPYIITSLTKNFDVLTNYEAFKNTKYELKQYDVLVNSDLCDVILVTDNSIYNDFVNNMHFDERIFEKYKKALWIFLYEDKKTEYFSDKYDLKQITIHNTTIYENIYYSCLNEFILQELLENSHLLLGQSNILILGYNRQTFLLCDFLQLFNPSLVICDFFYHNLIAAKSQELGIICKENLMNSHYKFDFVIISDVRLESYLTDKLKDKAKIIVINEELTKSIYEKYAQLLGKTIASAFRKEVRKYYQGV